MYSLRINNSHVGTMTLTAAILVIQATVVKVGDSAIIYQDLDDDGYYEDYDRACDITHFYHNGTELLHWNETVAEYNHSQDQGKKSHTSSHPGNVSRFKWDRKEHRAAFGHVEGVAFMKKMVRRSERRVGKEAIRTAMSEDI